MNGFVRYEWNLFEGKAAIQGDIHYRSEHFHSLNKSDAVTEDGYHVINARISWESNNRKWEVAAFVENVTDEEYILQSFDVIADLGWGQEYFGRPRWAGVSVLFNY